jgi:hypothetical protein
MMRWMGFFPGLTFVSSRDRRQSALLSYWYGRQSWVDRALVSERMRFQEELKPDNDPFFFSLPQQATASYHSHLIDPATGLAFLASRPQASTWPRSSYNRHVGTFLNVSIDPGQCRICCTFPAAMRDEPYACVMHARSHFPPEDADTTYHTRESSPWTPNVSSQRGRSKQ